MKKAIVYIDGFNLYYGIKALNKPNLKWLDLQALSESFLEAHKDTELVKVNYFTSIFPGEGVEHDKRRIRHKAYLSALELHCPKINIIKGHFRNEKLINCKECNNAISIPEEKRTDVNIACEMLKDSYENNFDVAYLISGDSDLVTPVELAVRKGKKVIVACPPNRYGRELVQASSGHFTIYRQRIRKCLLPPTVRIAEREFILPKEWQAYTLH